MQFPDAGTRAGGAIFVIYERTIAALLILRYSNVVVVTKIINARAYVRRVLRPSIERALNRFRRKYAGTKFSFQKSQGSSYRSCSTFLQIRCKSRGFSTSRLLEVVSID